MRIMSDPSSLTSKRTVYVGGLPASATTALVRAAMIPFGNIRSVDMPMDYVAGTHKGFCFCEYETADDADDAIFNMDGAELLGRVIRVSLANPNQVNKLLSTTSASGAAGGGATTTTTTSSKNQAIWKSDEWFQKHAVAGGGMDEQARADREVKEQDAKILQQEP